MSDTPTPRTRFPKDRLEKVISGNSSKQPDGCWAWSRCINSRGYGLAWDGLKGVLAHRLSYEVFNSDPGNLFVCHRCDVPHCVNPEHLFLGTNGDNSQDAYNKNRNPNAKIAQDKIASLIEAIDSGESTSKIAARFGVTPAAVWYWNNKRNEHGI